jgi:quinol monooxygenase YgiN
MSSQIVLLVKISLKPGRKPEFLEKLHAVVGVMAKEPSFINSTVHDNIENTDEVVVYETWKGSKESWLAEEYPRAYRKPYEDSLADLVVDRSVSWLKPLTSPTAPLP